MTSFGWLHLTDLHLGMSEQPGLLPLVKDRFFDSLKRLYEQSNPWDLVVFTGDLTFKGSAEEFQHVDEFLDQLWNCLSSLGANPSLVAVPGNHDLTRPDPQKPDPWLRLLRNNWFTDPEVQKQFWKDPQSEYRKPVNAAFENYIQWWEKTQFKLPARPGELPGEFSAILEKDGASLGIVGLNTAFLQLSTDPYEEKLDLDPFQFNQACGGDGPAWVKQRNASLLLTHHPPNWLTKESQEKLEGEIAGYDNFAVHLFGHMHETGYNAQSKAGAPELRVFQATSLFGLEYFGEANHQMERRHGYAAGRIDLEGENGRLTFWPKHANRAGNQLNIVVDTDIFTEGEHTLPRSFPLKKAFNKLVSAVADVVEREGAQNAEKQTANNRWAIMVGVNEYQYFDKLQYCRQDTIDFARALRDSQDFQNVFEFHENSVLKPERDVIFQKLIDIRESREVKPDDLLFFYFSGHGINEGGRDYLLPIGARPRDVSTLGIRVKDLVKSLKDIGCDNTLMFIDACRQAPVQGTKGPAAIGEDSNNVISESGIVAFFSCDPRERSYEIDPLKHGSFTFCILEAMQEGTVSTVSELAQYLKEKVPQINAKYEKPVQQPYAVIIPPAKGDLAILLSSRQPGRITKYGDLAVKVTELQDRGIIDVDDFVSVIGFLSIIESKTRPEGKETTKLAAIKALCDGTWTPAIFRRVWKTIERQRPTTPQIKK